MCGAGPGKLIFKLIWYPTAHSAHRLLATCNQSGRISLYTYIMAIHLTHSLDELCFSTTHFTRVSCVYKVDVCRRLFCYFFFLIGFPSNRHVGTLRWEHHQTTTTASAADEWKIWSKTFSNQITFISNESQQRQSTSSKMTWSLVWVCECKSTRCHLKSGGCRKPIALLSALVQLTHTRRRVA